MAIRVYTGTFITRLTVGIVVFVLVACSGGSKLLVDPRPLEIVDPLTQASDARLEIKLDWVIVRDGPGTWARNADWDEYLVRIKNVSNASVRIHDVAVYDSLGTRLQTNGRRPELVKASKHTAKRYKNKGLKVRAGVGSAVLYAAGGATYAVGAAAAVSAMTPYGVAAGSAATTAAVAVLVAPVLIAGGVIRGMNNAKVELEMIRRQTAMPAVIAPGEEKFLHLFFPLAPSPLGIEFKYVNAASEHQITVDTRDILLGLHISDVGANASEVSVERQ